MSALGQPVWACGFSRSFANQSPFAIYATNIGVPSPTPIALGLSGTYPVSLLIQIGMYPTDAVGPLRLLIPDDLPHAGKAVVQFRVFVADDLHPVRIRFFSEKLGWSEQPIVTIGVGNSVTISLPIDHHDVKISFKFTEPYPQQTATPRASTAGFVESRLSRSICGVSPRPGASEIIPQFDDDQIAPTSWSLKTWSAPGK